LELILLFLPNFEIINKCVLFISPPKAICSDLAPAQQKQLKKFDEAKTYIFKAAVYPIARH